MEVPEKACYDFWMSDCPRAAKLFLPVGWLAVLLVAFTLNSSAGHRQPAAAEGAPTVFRIQGAKSDFVHFTESRLLISRACQQKATGKLACDAYEAFQRAASFTAGPGDAATQARNLCKMTGGQPESGKDDQGEEKAFCRFDDGSLLDQASLLGVVGR